MQGKENAGRVGGAGIPDGVRELLHGARLLCVGPDSDLKRAVAEELARVGALPKYGFSCTCGDVPVRPEDVVFLFGAFDARESAVCLTRLTELLEAMARVSAAGVRRALLVSDLMVYGKIFGAPHPLREDEIGYVCHTAPADTAAQCMRTAEHLCARFAREDGFRAVIARADGDAFLAAADPERQMLVRRLLALLAGGEPGNAYNLPLPSALRRDGEESGSRDRSPLEPIAVIPDTGKADRYVTS